MEALAFSHFRGGVSRQAAGGLAGRAGGRGDRQGTRDSRVTRPSAATAGAGTSLAAGPCLCAASSMISEATLVSAAFPVLFSPENTTQNAKKFRLNPPTAAIALR